MHPELVTKAGVALIFLLHGLNLSFAALRAGVLNWRLHVFVQVFTYLVFPALGWIGWKALGGSVGSEMLLGFFFLCALPSTVSSSVAMTAAARGNDVTITWLHDPEDDAMEDMAREFGEDISHARYVVRATD